MSDSGVWWWGRWLRRWVAEVRRGGGGVVDELVDDRHSGGRGAFGCRAVGPQRVRGGGDRPAIDKQLGLLEALDELVHPDTRGTPMSALRWTLKSTYELAAS